MTAKVIVGLLILGVCGCSDSGSTKLDASDEKAIVDLVTKSASWKTCVKTSRAAAFDIKERDGDWVSVDCFDRIQDRNPDGSITPFVFAIRVNLSTSKVQKWSRKDKKWVDDDIDS